MDNNELNRRIRYALQLDDSQTMRLMSLIGDPPELEQVSAWRLKEEEDGFQPCPDAAMNALLDGLILDRRGPPAAEPDTDPGHAGPGEASDRPGQATRPGHETMDKTVDNNSVLKQLRIALSLRSDEVHELVTAGGGKLNKTEIGALFRKPGTRNYRRCGDQVIRWFLAGLAERRDN